MKFNDKSIVLIDKVDLEAIKLRYARLEWSIPINATSRGQSYRKRFVDLSFDINNRLLKIMPSPFICLAIASVIIQNISSTPDFDNFVENVNKRRNVAFSGSGTTSTYG